MLCSRPGQLIYLLQHRNTSNLHQDPVGILMLCDTPSWCMPFLTYRCIGVYLHPQTFGGQGESTLALTKPHTPRHPVQA